MKTPELTRYRDLLGDIKTRVRPLPNCRKRHLRKKGNDWLPNYRPSIEEIEADLTESIGKGNAE